MDEDYIRFCDLLKESKEKGILKMLHRGMTKDFAFNELKLDVNFNTIDQFKEKLYFYGEKSKYFWNDKLNTSKDHFEFDINDTSEDFFTYIFKEFNKLIQFHTNQVTTQYFEKNITTISFFSQLRNIKLFLLKINHLSAEERINIRNYYLRILHQLGESTYKKNSQFISSSTSEKVPERLKRNEIIINFWDLDFSRPDITADIPKFVGKPYKNQKEISVFTVILPHFIYSFKYQNSTYPNPAIKTTKNLEFAILCGLDIIQENFSENLKKDTNYNKGIETDGKEYWEIK